MPIRSVGRLADGEDERSQLHRVIDARGHATEGAGVHHEGVPVRRQVGPLRGAQLTGDRPWRAGLAASRGRARLRFRMGGFSICCVVVGLRLTSAGQRTCDCISVAGVQTRRAARRRSRRCLCAREHGRCAGLGPWRPVSAGSQLLTVVSDHPRPCFPAALVGAESVAGGVGPARPRQVSCVSRGHMNTVRTVSGG